MSLRVRLVLISLAGIAFIAVAAVVFAYRSVGDAGVRRADQMLREQAAMVARSSGDDVVAPVPRDAMEDRPLPQAHGGGRRRQGVDGHIRQLPDRFRQFELVARIITADGTVRGQSVSASEVEGLPRPASRLPPEGRARTVTIRGTPYRIFEQPTARGATVQVARPLPEVNAALDRLRRVLVVIGVCAVLGSTLLSWWSAGAVLAPIRRMTVAADEIRRTRNLEKRVPVGHVDKDFAQLGASLNAMLDGLEGSDRIQRAFVADASHELRTPLTSMRGNVEFVAQRLPADEGELRDAAQAVMRDIDRLAELADSLTALARIDAAAPVRADLVDVEVLVNEEVARATASYPGHRFTVDVELDGPVCSDPELLRRIVANLVANAGRHTPRGTSVRVCASRANDSWRLEVSDDGPGLAEQDVELVFERFRRGSRTPSGGGTGLGLAIVRSAAQALGGSAQVMSVERGMSVMVQLPLASQ